MIRLCLLLSLTLFLTAASAKTVVIDAGHGGHDRGGAYGKIYEKHLALDTALRVQYYLKKKGYKTVMTRSKDSFVSLGRRASLANSRQDALFISIHYNFTWKSHVEGLETFYHSASGRQLAELCHAGIHRKVRANDRGVKSSRFHVLRQCKHPAILVEGGFLSHAKERERCKQGTFRDGIARGIVDGVVDFDRSGQW